MKVAEVDVVFDELVANAEGALAGLELPAHWRLAGKLLFHKVREIAQLRRDQERELRAAIANLRSRLEALEQSHLVPVSSCRLVTRAPGTCDPGGRNCLTCNSRANGDEPVPCKGVTAFIVR